MSMAGFGNPDWLPPRILARVQAEEAAEAREAKRAEQERQDRAEAAHERAAEAFRSAAEARGEHVTALALATGQVTGRGLDEIFSDAEAAADRSDAREAARQRRREMYGDPADDHDDGSGWPESERAAERQLRQLQELHSDLNRFRARRDYPRALEAARAKQRRSHGYAERDEYPGVGAEYGDAWR